MRTHEIMSAPVLTIDATEAASTAWTRMRQRRVRHLVVTDDAHLVGIVSERDLGGRGGAALRKGRTVGELMTPGTVTVQPRTTLRQAANLMRGRQIGSLPVLDGDRLVGIVTATDVLDALGRGVTRPAARAERRTLRAPPAGARRAGRPVVRRRRPAGVEAGRARPRTPDSTKRAPFARRVPRAVKRKAGRTDAPLVPAHVRAMGVGLDRDHRSYIRRKLGAKLGKFAPSIERVSVRVEDVNGPRGGVDQACRIKVVLSGLPSVVFEAQDASLDAAIDAAIAGTERAVRRALRRRRARPLRGRTRRATVSTG